MATPWLYRFNAHFYKKPGNGTVNGFSDFPIHYLAALAWPGLSKCTKVTFSSGFYYFYSCLFIVIIMQKANIWVNNLVVVVVIACFWLGYTFFVCSAVENCGNCMFCLHAWINFTLNGPFSLNGLFRRVSFILNENEWVEIEESTHTGRSRAHFLARCMRVEEKRGALYGVVVTVLLHDKLKRSNEF